MAQYSPLFFPELNGLTSGVNPPGVYTTNNATTIYFQRMLYQRAMSVFDWTIPEEWDKNFLQYCLCFLGYSIVVDSDKIARVAAGHCGIVPQAGTLYGYGIFYQPTRANVVSPLLEGTALTIGEDCELIRLTPDYMGIWDIIQTYAELLSQASTATSMSLQNSRVAFAIAAKNKSAAQTIKAIYDKVQRGEPGVVFDGNFIKDSDGADPQPWAAFQQSVKDCYVADMTLEAYDTILHQFDEEVGIPSLRGAAGNKKERLLTDEIHRNDSATTARASVWLDCLNQSLERVNSMFGLSLSVKMREMPELEGGEPDANENNVAGA